MNEHQIREACSRHSGLAVLSDATLALALDRVADRFVNERDRVRWWTSLKGDIEVDSYGTADGLTLLRERLRGVSSELTLVITDDDPPPWLGIRGELPELLSLLADLPCCEFFVFDDRQEWLLFDTHHNELIVARKHE
ncbi:MAG: hypothetical protein RL885_21680 [Planctomycetota bacterium]